MKRKKFALVLLTGALLSTSLYTQTHQVLAKEKSKVINTTKIKSTDSKKKPGKTETNKTEKGYRIENNLFQIDVGQHGEIASLILKQDKFKTNYVMNETDNPKQNTAGHQWVGELMFRTKTENSKEWQKEYTGPSKSARKIELDDNKVIVTYESATEENGIKNMKIIETYALIEDKLQWTIDIQNTTSEKLTIGDFGIPLPFREFWTYPPKEGENESTTAYEGSVLDHSFVGQDASYIYATRPSGMGNFLVMTPDVVEGTNSFEYQDHWVVGTNGRTEEENAWSMDQEGWANGLNVFYVHSEAIKEENKGYLPNSALKLNPGESKRYTYNFHASDLNEEDNESDMSATKYETALKQILYKENIMDAVSIPGMVIPKNSEGKAVGQMYLHTPISKDKISFEHQCTHNDQLTGGTHNIDDTDGVPHVENGSSVTYKDTITKDGEQYHIYDISFDELGTNNIIVNYEIEGQAKKTTLQYYIIDDPESALAQHSQFLLKTQWDAPGELQDKVFDDWMMDTKSKRGEFGGYWGWGDDWGLVHGTFLAEMNSKTPKKEQVAALDEYLDVAIWNGLMQEHHEDFLIHDFLMQEPNNTPTYRGFAYPHIYNTYFAMYKIAKDNPDLIDYKESADDYLMKTYQIMEALYKDGVGYNWHTGVMGEIKTPEIIQELKARGYNKEAGSIEKKMETKYNNFAKDKYPYVSEYPYDNTSEEAIYMLGNLHDDTNMMSMVDLKTRACRGVQPIWYHYGNPTTICGENWFNFQYTASLAGSAMDDWLRNQNNGMNASEMGLAARANYAGKLANLTHINSGQISSDPENIGTVSWTYQAELGNYEAMGTGGGNMHNGWRQMSGEADLSLFGALQILSTDVVKDPIFGLIGYGGSVKESQDSYNVKPNDGLRQRINLINEQLSYEVETDKFKEATVNTKDKEAIFDIENITKKSHYLKLTITDTKSDGGETYQVLYNGKQVGTFESTKKTTTLQIPITAEDGKLEIKKAPLDKNSMLTIELPETIEVSLDEAQDIRLLGKARDTAWLQKQAGPKWTVKEKPQDSEVNFSAANNEITSASFDKIGEYVLNFTAKGLNDTQTKELIVRVNENQTPPQNLANYDFSIKENDIVTNTIRNIGKTGYDSALKGNKATIKTEKDPSDGQALVMNGKVGGYVQLNPKLTKHVQEATATIDVNLKEKQVAGARILEWKDTEGNLISLRFSTENELELVAKSKDGEEKSVKSGVSLLVNQWRNLELTMKNKEIILYIDGAKIAEIKDVDLTLADFNEVQRSFIGRSDSESSPWFNGRIDNFTLMSKALSTEEIQNEYGTDTEETIESLQTISLVTSVNQAPKLPEQLIAQYNNGTSRKVPVEWEPVDSKLYANIGDFKVNGTVAATDLKAEATVQVVRGEEINLASSATPSAIVDTPEDLGGVAGLNDGFEPENSGDTSHGVWHNWLGGDQSGESWVQYSWDEEVLVTGMDSYYFFNGSNFAPSSVRLAYMDGNGNWQEFQNIEGSGVVLDQYNKTKFDPVSTKQIRMYMNPVNLGTGVIEWKVYGYANDTSDIVYPENVELNNTGIKTLKKGLDLQLETTVTPSDAHVGTLTYESNRPEIATVDEEGLVTAVKAGTAKITVTTENGKKASFTLRVTK